MANETNAKKVPAPQEQSNRTSAKLIYNGSVISVSKSTIFESSKRILSDALRGHLRRSSK